MNRRAIVAVLALMGCGDPVAPPATPSATPAAIPPAVGSLLGTVRLAGIEIKPRHDLKYDDSLILGPGQVMANVYVAVRSGLGDRRFSTASNPVLLRHGGSLYEPRVVGLMTNQPLKVRNGDDKLHNVRITSNFGRPFNIGLAKGSEEGLTFPKPEIGMPVMCDVHPWERAWIHVSDHPFLAVTAIDGAYSIPGLPPGEYEILAWHERFKDAPLISKVKVEAGKASTLDFTFEAPSK